jgi:phage tail sheath protein FI
MSETVSRPGMDVEETASGVHPIAGVATSVTAFLGAAAQGPTDEAVAIAGFEDFDRTFGGLDVRHPWATRCGTSSPTAEPEP